MPQKFVIPSKLCFLKELRTRTPGWSLSYVSTPDYSSVFALAPTIDGPLMIGDEMFINDPIIPINDHKKACYGFTTGADTKDLPDDTHELARIWRQAKATYEFVKGKQDKAYCATCKGDRSFSTGLTKKGHFCRKCFGMGIIYTYGPQRKLGKRLLQGSSIKIVNGSMMLEFQPDGLSALLSLYDYYHTGIVADIAQKYLIDHAYSVIKDTFPHVTVFITYDHLNEEGLCDFVYDKDGKIWNRHFYMPLGNKLINLYTGKEETLQQNNLIPVTRSRDLPDTFRWNVTLDIMRNLCKFAK